MLICLGPIVNPQDPSHNGSPLTHEQILCSSQWRHRNPMHLDTQTCSESLDLQYLLPQHVEQYLKRLFIYFSSLLSGVRH